MDFIFCAALFIISFAIVLVFLKNFFLQTTTHNMLLMVEWFLFEKTGIQQVVPNCYRTAIPKFHFEMLLFNLVQGLS